MLVIACNQEISVRSCRKSHKDVKQAVSKYVSHLAVEVCISILEDNADEDNWHKINSRARELDSELVLKVEHPATTLSIGMP